MSDPVQDLAAELIWRLLQAEQTVQRLLSRVEELEARLAKE